MVLKILDLYSGSGSWSNQWRDNHTYDIEIDSVDITKKPHINYNMDARIFYKENKDKKYDLVFASPPCEKFSQLNRKVTNEEIQDKLDLVKIAFHFCLNAKIGYVLENPHTGLLKNIYPNCIIVDYSEYDYPMRKRTALWTNIPLSLKLRADLSKNRIDISALPKEDRSKIPYKLVKHIKEVILKRFNQELRPHRKNSNSPEQIRLDLKTNPLKNENLKKKDNLKAKLKKEAKNEKINL